MRIRAELQAAKKGGHYTNGWYAYIARWDVETLVAGVLGPEPEPRLPEEIVGGIELDGRCIP